LSCETVFDICEKWLHTLGKSKEFNNACRENFTLCNIVHRLVNTSGFLDALILLQMGHRKQLLKCGIDLHTLGSREEHELGRLNDEGKTGSFAHKSLQVVSAILHKSQVFVSDGFLWRDSRNGDARPPLAQGDVELVEFRVATLALPDTLAVFSFALVNNVAIVVLGVLHIEIFLVVVHKETRVLLEDFGGDFDLFGILRNFGGFDHIFFFKY